MKGNKKMKYLPRKVEKVPMKGLFPVQIYKGSCTKGKHILNLSKYKMKCRINIQENMHSASVIK